MAQKSHAREYMEKFNGIAIMNMLRKSDGNSNDPKARLRALASSMKDASIEYNVVTDKKEGVASYHYMFEDNSSLVMEWNALSSKATLRLTEQISMQC